MLNVRIDMSCESKTVQALVL